MKKYIIVLGLFFMAGNANATYFNKQIITDGTNDVDVISNGVNSFVTIDADLAIAENGYTFEASTVALAVANEGFLKVYVVIGSSNARVSFDVGSEGKALVKGYSLTTVSDSGSAMLTTSKNFINQKVNTLNAYYDPVITSSGTPVFIGQIFGGEGPKTVGASATEPRPWFCNANASFLLTIQNTAGSAKDIVFRMFWIESNP